MVKAKDFPPLPAAEVWNTIPNNIHNREIIGAFKHAYINIFFFFFFFFFLKTPFGTKENPPRKILPQGFLVFKA